MIKVTKLQEEEFTKVQDLQKEFQSIVYQIGELNVIKYNITKQLGEIETEITNFLSELRKDYEEGEFIKHIIDIFIAMKTSARDNNLKSLLSSIDMLLNHINVFIEYLVMPSPDTDNMKAYTNIFSYVFV
jgi:chaperonin cofactor prefoldin